MILLWPELKKWHTTPSTLQPESPFKKKHIGLFFNVKPFSAFSCPYDTVQFQGVASYFFFFFLTVPACIPISVI